MKKLVVLPLIVALSSNAIVLGQADAAMVRTTDIIAGDSANRDQVNTFMGREEVRREFVKLGVDPNEAAARVSALSDQEVSSIAERLDELPAGEGAIGAIVGAAVLIFIVLLITDITCLTHVFNFTRCATK